MERHIILTWHVHGSYLYYLSMLPHDILLPVRPGRPEGYGGRTGPFAWPGNVREVPAEEVSRMRFDLVLYQSRRNWEVDRHEILSEAQRRGPSIYLEHDPPREQAVDQRHLVDDPEVLLVHVTHFNDLMWDAGRTPTRVIEHGVVVPDDVRYTGDIDRGIAVVNGMDWRGRRVGADIYRYAAARAPLELVGMGSERVGGLGEVPYGMLHAFESQYRFFFNPIRYTSMPLALCEAMMLGMPVIAPATTEVADVIVGGENGFASTNVDALVDAMRFLADDRGEALRLGAGARRTATQRFRVARFVRDWDGALTDVAGVPTMAAQA